MHLCLIALLLCSGAQTGRAEEQTIQFSGLEWRVKNGEKLGPGPNAWRAANVSVDKNGALHLKITRQEGKWYCAEVESTRRFGFGRYQFEVIGRIDKLDKNVVLGLFNYPTSEVGPDGTNELDIELAHWGNDAYPPLNFTVWPAKADQKNNSYTQTFTLTGDYTTHRFIWHRDRVLFQSLHGHRDDDKEEFGHWLFKPKNPALTIGQKPMPLLLNLWLFQGQPPADGKEVEIIIQRVSFVPQ